MPVSRRTFVGQFLTLTSLHKLANLLGAEPQPNVLLQTADENGLALLNGFSSRVVAVEGLAPVSGGAYLWHRAPDGGAVFADQDKNNTGGWIYVSNCESNSVGGAGALKFNASGDVIDAYRILDGTLRNCAGGKTPWGTWLSAEEVNQGRIWECDPQGNASPLVHPALGTFRHEAAAIDPINACVYLTEDKPDGCFYRTVLSHYPALSQGVLQVAEEVTIDGQMTLIWHDVPNPNPSEKETPTRYQVKSATIFKGGEGIWYHQDKVYFATKGDNRVWCLSLADQVLSIIYDYATASHPALRGVDNLTVHNNGQIYVCEDGGNLEIVMLGENGWVLPIMRIDDHTGSEVTGVAFTDDGHRMYFSSQRGPSANGNLGITYEVTGPFDALDVIFQQGFE